MANSFGKYSSSDRRLSGSDGLGGEAYSGPRASAEEEKNFQHWLINKICEYHSLSKTARLIIADYIESNWKDLKIAAPDLLSRTQELMMYQYNNPPKAGIPDHIKTFAKTLSELDDVSAEDWRKLVKALNKQAVYQPVENSDLNKISALGNFIGLSNDAHAILNFVCTLNASTENLRKALVKLGINRPNHFCHLMTVCFGGSVETYRQALDELYSCGIFESPLTDPSKLPAVSKYVVKLAQDHKSTEEMINAIFGVRRKAKFSEQHFSHIAAVRDRIGAYIRKSIQNPMLAKGILLYGAAGVGKTEFATVDIEGIETRFIGEPKADGVKLGASERLSALLLAIKLAGRSGKDQSHAVKLVFDEFEDVLRHFLTDTGEHFEVKNDHSKLMLNRLLEAIRSPVLLLANVQPEDLPDYITTRLILVEMVPPTGRHQVPIIKRLDRSLPIRQESGRTRSGLGYGDMKELAGLYDTSPRVWGTVVSAACMMDDPLCAAKRELEEYVKAGVAKRRPAISLPRNYDPRLINITTDTPFGTPVGLYTERLIKKARADIEANKAGLDDVRPLMLLLDGGPGTGKTEYAKYLALKIGMGAKSVKGGDLLNSLLGGTEGHVKQLFASALRENCAIIFEEADSLLLNREQATQRWQYSIVNDFNAHLNSHPCPVIFTTNLGSKLDAATRSRMQMLRFGALTAEQVRLACGIFFNNQVLAGRLCDVRGITLRDFVNLKAAAALEEKPVTPDNIRSALSRIMRNRTAAAISS
jgi:DNA polymerase III delta prime subunit